MKLLVATVIGLCLSLPIHAYGQPTPAEHPAADESQPDVAPLDAGQTAPFDGILVSEARAVAYARLQIHVEELMGRLVVRERLLTETAEALAEARAAIGEAQTHRCEESWWSSNKMTVGFLLGVVGSGLLVWAAVSVLDSAVDDGG